MFILSFFFSRIVFNTYVSYFVARAYYLTTKDVGVSIYTIDIMYLASWSSYMAINSGIIPNLSIRNLLHSEHSLVHGNTQACLKVVQGRLIKSQS